MHHFTANKSIKLQMAPPLHPSSNPVETFMRPLGKAMKIAHQTGTSEREALESTLNSYRHTPHPASGIPPAAMMFRDGQRVRGHTQPKKTSEEQTTKRNLKTKKKSTRLNIQRRPLSISVTKFAFQITKNRGSLIPFS